MKMIQTEISLGMPSHETFYDGQIRVDYSGGTFGVVDVLDENWQNTLYMRGYRPVEEEVTSSSDDTPKTTRRKKVADE